MKFIPQMFCLAAVPMCLAYGCAATGGQAATQAPVRQRGPVFDAQLTVSGGSYEHDTDGSFKDDTQAAFLGLIVEGSSPSGFGGGLSLEVMGSDDNLFENQAASPAQAATFQFAPFFLYRVRAGERFRMPVRVGPWVHVLTLEDQATSNSLDWVSYGLRAAVEPEFALLHSPDFDLTVFAGLSLAGGVTTINVDTPIDTENFDSSAAAFGFEVGPRFRWRHFFGGISYLYREFSAAESDPRANVTVPGIDTTYDGIAVTFGGGF